MLVIAQSSPNQAQLGIGCYRFSGLLTSKTLTPDAFLGRVNSVFRFVGWGTMPLGALLGGLIGEAFGVRAVFVAMTALGAVLVLPAQFIRQERMREPAGQ